jgi:hypothetical protein
MRARTAAEAQALGELCGNIMALATAAYVTWSTVIAFAGGTVPLTRWDVAGGAQLGLFWMFVIDPLVVSVALVLAYVAVAVLTLVLRLNPGLPWHRRANSPLHGLP